MASVCLFIALLMLPAGIIAQSPDAIDAPRIDQSEFKKLIAAKNVVIVDTRNEGSFAEGHMPGALLLPLEGQMTWPESYEKTVAQLIASKRPVVTYCA
jgi:predicted sulfurtransferase